MFFCYFDLSAIYRYNITMLLGNMLPCPATLARFIHQTCASKRNFYFLLSWPETKELLKSQKIVWVAISRSNSIGPENILFLTHHNAL